MKTALDIDLDPSSASLLSTPDLLQLLEEKDRVIADREAVITEREALIKEQQKLLFQGELFDEAELEISLGQIEKELEQAGQKPPRKPRRKPDGFAENLPRIQVHLRLDEKARAGATRTFFTKVKEELDIVPAQARVIEYWQERPVFEQPHGEQRIKTLDPEDKTRHRQRLACPVLDDLKQWLENNSTRVPRDSLTWQPMQYILNQWDRLIGYCEDGQLRISNALTENAIRPFAVGRRNWLFADTPRGAKASATIYSLIETAKANGLEPFAYLHHVLRNIGTAETVDQIEALLPWNVDLKAAQEG